MQRRLLGTLAGIVAGIALGVIVLDVAETLLGAFMAAGVAGIALAVVVILVIDALVDRDDRRRGRSRQKRPKPAGV